MPFPSTTSDNLARYNAEGIPVEEHVHGCDWCGRTTENKYCSTKCGNIARMNRYKHRQLEAIRDRHYERIELFKKMIRYEILDMHREVHAKGLENY